MERHRLLDSGDMVPDPNGDWVKYEDANQAQICCDSYAAENQRFHDEIERLKAEVESPHLQMVDILGQRT